MNDDITTDAGGAESAEPSSGQHPDPSARADADTTDRPDGTETAAADEKPIPFSRHKDILEHTRREFEDRYGWAKDLDRQRVERDRSIAEAIDRDPEGAIRWLQQQTRRSPVSPAAMPQPNLRTEDGQLMYDAEQAQKLVDYHLGQLRQEYDARLSPIERQHVMTAAQDRARADIEEAESWPHFNDHLEQITDAIANAQRQGRPISLERAYLTIVVPKLQGLERQAVAKDLKTKSAASDRVRPGQPLGRSAQSDADRPLADLVKEELAARGR